MAGTTAFILLFDNATLWSKGFEIFSGYLGQLYILMLAMFSLFIAFFAVFGSRKTLQPFLAFMLILASITSYYMDTLGVIIDRDMIQNVMTSTFTESKHLVTFGFIFQIIVWGILPAIAVFCFKLPKRPFVRSILINTGLIVLCLSITVGLLFTNFKTYSSVARERKDFMASQQPGAALVGTVRYYKRLAETQDITIEPIGTDAKKGKKFAAAKKPVLTLLVIGETARNQNFGLDGYERQTTPELAKRSVVNYSDVNSCGTATATSLPCMFSKFGRSSYSYKKGISNENLVDVLGYAGIDVEWWDNNTGDKNLAARTKSRKFTNLKNEEFCPTGECMDGIFQQFLEEKINNIKQDTVLVLHLIGSHGPTYYLRYPDEFEVYKPACRTAEFKKCTTAEIVNAYDNTMVYTDHILASTIDLLAKNKNYLTSLVYVSDHGESLGENGLYLHGSPYFLAPETQTKVPMIIWMSPSYKEQFGIDQACLEANADTTISHANLFHSVLGMLDIETSERKDDLDVFAKCKL
jgi:lipid A ethanolaminephosphotransferase